MAINMNMNKNTSIISLSLSCMVDRICKNYLIAKEIFGLNLKNYLSIFVTRNFLSQKNL
ncbi:hypothetical protein METP2_03059 [Methanosarcinales archaeon]|nr:hypothetical protein METP2_03059 [Methanosarcinales archaeon]